MAIDRFARDRDAFKLPEGDYYYVDVDELPEMMAENHSHLRCATCGVRLEFTEVGHCTYCKGLLEDSP